MSGYSDYLLDRLGELVSTPEGRARVLANLRRPIPATDPFGYRERINEEAQRQLEMLRVTLTERIAECTTKAGRRAYQDVVDLLGPAPAWWNDPDTKEPF